MLERRRRESPDSGVRTRRTDHNATAHSFQEWITTFNLRWVEHLRRHDHNGRPHASSSAGA